MTMRSTVFALVTATTAICFFGAAGSASAGHGETVCTWGGTPAAPTGVATFSPGITNTPSTGPIEFTATGELGGGEGCTGRLTFRGVTIALTRRQSLRLPYQTLAPPRSTTVSPSRIPLRSFI